MDSFTLEDPPHLTFSQALTKSDDFIGTFRREEPKVTLVEAYANAIQNDDGTENYCIVALIDVTEREKAQREEFARQIRDKDTLLKEVQHRVKNNLQLVVALIRLEARNERRGHTVKLAELAGRIETLQLLYQAISPESLGGELELGHYLNQIASAVMNAYGIDFIRLDSKIGHVTTSINIAMPVGLLVNELMTNAFKHAFVGRGSGIITLECLRTSEDHYQVTVADNGIGLPPDTVWPVPGKISALIVQTLSENTNTNLKVESELGKGTRVTISFVHKPAFRKIN